MRQYFFSAAVETSNSEEGQNGSICIGFTETEQELQKKTTATAKHERSSDWNCIDSL